MTKTVLLFTIITFFTLKSQAQEIQSKNIPCKDFDGNVYKTITIGTQLWMAENLKTTHYKDGSIIQNITEDTAWNMHSTAAFCIYNNVDENKSTYGLLYNWFAVVDKRGLAPDGWHIPTDREWLTLIDFLGGSETVCNKLREPGDTHWSIPNTEVKKVCGFNALPGGSRNSSGVFSGMENYTCWWTSSESLWVDTPAENPVYLNAFYFTLKGDETPVTDAVSDKAEGMSIRCVKDQ